MALARLDIELRAIFEKLGSDVDEAVNILERAQDKVEAFQKKFQTAFEAIGTIVFLEGIKKLTEGINELAASGEKAQNLEQAFVSLGGSVNALDRAKEATMGVVSAVDLMAEANKGLLAGIPGFAQNFDKIADLGARVGQALGTSAKDGIDAVTQAIIKGRAPALERVGIFINTAAAAKTYAQAHGIAATATGDFEKALNKQQKALANAQEAMGHLDEAIGRFAPVVDTATKAQTAAKNSWDELLEAIGRQINANPELIKAWRDLQDTIKKIDFGQLGTDLAMIEAAFVNLANLGIKVADGAIEGLIDTVKRLKIAFVDYQDYQKAHPFISAIPGVGTAMAATHAFNQSGPELQAQKMVEGMDSVNSATAEWEKRVQSAFDAFQKGIKPTTAQVEVLQKDITDINADTSKRGLVMVDNDEMMKSVSQMITLKDNAVAVKNAGDGIGNGIDKAAAAVQKLNDELAKLHAQTVSEEVKHNFEEALKLGNFDVAQDYLDKYKTAVAAAADEAAKKYKGANSDAIQQFKDDFIAKAIPPMQDALQNAFGESVKSHFEEALKAGNYAAAQDFLSQYQQILPTLGEKGKLTFKEMTDQFQKGLEAAMKELISGVGEFTSSIEQVTSGMTAAFGIKIPAGMQKTLDIAKGLTSIFDGILRTIESVSKIMEAISKLSVSTSSGSPVSALGTLSTLFGGSGGTMSGIGPFASGADYASAVTGNIGPFASGADYASTLSSAGGASSLAAYGPYAGVAGGLYAAGQSVSDVQKGNSLGAGLWGTVAGGVATGGLAAIGAAIFGGGGPKNPDTVARNAVADYINGILAKSPLVMMNGKTLGSLDFGSSSQFNQPGWGPAQVAKYGASNFGAFGAVGSYIAQQQGVSQNVAPQIAAQLQNAMKGNLKDLALLMDKLNISEQQVDDTMVQAAKDGTTTWNQAIHSLNSLHSALQPGIEGTAKLSAAMKELHDSGGKGTAALQAVKDMAEEAKEAGVHSFDQWTAALEKAGVSADQATAFITALKNAGFKDGASIFTASDQQLGTVVSNFQDLGGTFKQLAQDAGDTNTAVAGLPSSKDITINFSSTMDDQTKAGLTAAGYFNSGNVSVPSTSDTTASNVSVPSTRVATFNARSFMMPRVAAAPTIHIHAQGAAPGVEHDIHRAMQAYMPHLVKHAVEAVNTNRGRGGSLRATFDR